MEIGKLKKIMVSPLAPTSGFPDLPPIKGVRFAAGSSGIKKNNLLDLMMVELSPGTVVTGVLTRSSTCSEAVLWCKRLLTNGNSNDSRCGIIVNSGNANVFTGDKGRADVEKTANHAAEILKTSAENIFVASTGVIGEQLPVEKILNKLSALGSELNSYDAKRAAEAIMTTDTYPKGAFKTVNLQKTLINISGFAKGSGMIAPNMATMLVFIFTDILIKKELLQKIVSKINKRTFNAITVDSDTSTSDTMLVAATGTAIMEPITIYRDPRALIFEKGLEETMRSLAHQVVRDGEGATKFVEINVAGAKSKKSAFRIGKSIAESPLVKTAFAGEDPNWGRIIMAIGKTSEAIKTSKLSVKFGSLSVTQNGSVAECYSEKQVAQYMKNNEIVLSVDLGVGEKSATVWTCDLTKNYVSINADYRS